MGDLFQCNEHSEARPEGRRDPKFVNTGFEDKRAELECDLDDDDDDENLSFSKKLKAKELSVGFKMPFIEKYNRRGDPTDHINVYKMRLQDNILAVMCWNFHAILVSNAKRWYNKLKPRSIKSWQQLKQEFINVFIGNQIMITNITQLYDIR
ncbi:Retrotrans gag domain-containing protein [Abeliophyllum distichum]|uniref:Retrotrans gag domain-containing protein n=1 Tax=Abeliophyllum distichum TaxID=126358 RepID=A0ABD1PEG1_9LAMI